MAQVLLNATCPGSPVSSTRRQGGRALRRASRPRLGVLACSGLVHHVLPLMEPRPARQVSFYAHLPRQRRAQIEGHPHI
ncbi:hypothetical protein FIBSPDRAFT_851611 [Athelia psychrophila]|uniref:Uncharacterized protein n=1 Tax=Athelia psychrophila TaxID=1759441 RepID=A0A166SBC9_9AGAM|nr:hypothetical protein FIBSPDRAFT_851611 [Fibularhizoctonia sp. CBS 109695]